MAISLRVTGVLGVLLFGSLFLVAFELPEKIEQSAKNLIKSQVEAEMRQKYQ